MIRALHLLATCVAITIATFTVAGCGNNDAVVRFESPHASISRPTLNHWMEAIAGDEIRRNLGTEGPSGLASEPADYPRCFAAAKLVGPRSFFNQLRLDRVQVTEKCHELHRAIKTQALSFLISSHWTLVESAERGIRASPAEVQEALEGDTRLAHPSGARLRRFLAERHWSLADVRYLARLAVLAGRLHPDRVHKASGIGGSYFTLAAEHSQDLIARTLCRRGYAAPGCRGYEGPPSASPSPEAILGQLTGHLQPVAIQTETRLPNA